MSAIQAFKSALMDKLKTTGTPVAAAVGDRVFDYVPPEKTPSPHLYIAAVVGTKDRSACGHQWMIRVRIYVVTSDYKKEGPLNVAIAVSALLDEQMLTLPEGYQQTKEIDVTSIGEVDDPQQPANTFVDLTAMAAG